MSILNLGGKKKEPGPVVPDAYQMLAGALILPQPLDKAALFDAAKEFAALQKQAIRMQELNTRLLQILGDDGGPLVIKLDGEPYTIGWTPQPGMPGQLARRNLYFMPCKLI